MERYASALVAIYGVIVNIFIENWRADWWRGTWHREKYSCFFSPECRRLLKWLYFAQWLCQNTGENTDLDTIKIPRAGWPLVLDLRCSTICWIFKSVRDNCVHWIYCPLATSLLGFAEAIAFLDSSENSDLHLTSLRTLLCISCWLSTFSSLDE